MNWKGRVVQLKEQLEFNLITADRILNSRKLRKTQRPLNADKVEFDVIPEVNEVYKNIAESIEKLERIIDDF